MATLRFGKHRCHCDHEVETSAESDSEESRAVLADNALKLLPRLAGSAM
jgi:hypothetical protein